MATSKPPLTSMPDWLAQRAALSPHEVALFDGQERQTFAELELRVSVLSYRLREIGVNRGDRVALLARNSERFVHAVHAIARLGAVVLPLNVRLTTLELSHQVSDVAATLVVADEYDAEAAAALQEALPGLRTVSVEALSGASDDAVGVGAASAPRSVDLSERHSIIYTSGTGGQAKGVMLTYGNHFWSAMGSALNLGLREDDRWLACLPLFHVGGLAIIMRSVIYGMPVIVHEAFDPQRVNHAIREDAVTIVSVVATMLQRMLEDSGGEPYPPSLRCVLVGGGPVSKALLEECAARNVPVVQTYGLTEAASQVVTLSPKDALTKLGSAGKPLFPTEVRIKDERDVDLPAGIAGEITVRGPTVMAGYFNNPGETQRALQDGWLHTGDIGYLDDDGYLYVLDRRDDLIVTGGENVYPAEVEEVFRRHAQVLEAAVVGLPDERWGQAVVATVVRSPGATVGEDDLRSFCRGQLASYKVPARIRFGATLPRNASGKLLRRALRDQWLAGEDA